ncbi:MAG: zinc ribbon domain-containing protein, partial [Syntrophomonadaceae bacterium]|nr:zinc ribbon domain-containing protein [Syntrophomonadaceae bacterium]
VIGWLVYLIARPMLISCPNCNQEQSNDLKFCTSCGALLKSCCTECGGELKGDGEYCGSCGHKMGP